MPGSDDVRPDPELPTRDFTHFEDLFATRDNLRQHALDLLQLGRVLAATGPGSLAARLRAADPGLPLIDGTQVGFLGHSLGAMLGVGFLATSPTAQLGVLNVGGGRLVDIFSRRLDPLAERHGVTPGSAQHAELLDRFRWAMDPGDPINLARNVRLESLESPLQQGPVPVKQVIVQQAGRDQVLTGELACGLVVELGLRCDAQGRAQGIDREGQSPAWVSTFFADADHGALLSGTTTGVAMQEQAVRYLASGLYEKTPRLTPPP